MQDKKQFILYGIVLVLGLSILANLLTPVFQKTGDPNVAIFVYILISLCLFLVLYNYQATPSRREKELALLRRVRSSWTDLERWLAGAVLLDLDIQWESGALTPSNQQIDLIRQQERADTNSILEIFRISGRSLLVLGEAGSGKTVILVRLARELLNRAEKDESELISVILNLSTWNKPTPFKEWLIQEMASKYDIAEELSEQWLLEQRLVLLLDGLDETPDKEECVKAINIFLKDIGTGGIAVSSRTLEYKRASKSEKLNVNTAISVKRLDPRQIDRYLIESGSELAAPDSIVRTHKSLSNLARTPLMLSLMVLVGKTPGAFDGFDCRNGDDCRETLLETYIKQRHQLAERFNVLFQRKLISWLQWLAQGMGAHSQSVFLIEKLQPSWLPKSNRKWLTIYVLCSRFIGALCGILIGVLTLRFAEKIGAIVYPSEDLNTQRPIEWMGVTGALWRWLVVTILFGGLAMAGLDLARFANVPSRKNLTRSRIKARLIDVILLRKNSIPINILYFLVIFFGAAYIVRLGWKNSAKGAVTYAVIFGLVAWVRSRGNDVANDIRTADRLVWSSRSMPGGLGWGWAGGFLIGLVVPLTVLLDVSVIAVTVAAGIGLVIGILKPKLIPLGNPNTRSRAQSGLLLSAALGTVTMIIVLAASSSLGLKIAGLFAAMGALVGLVVKGLTKVSIIEKTSPNQGIKLSVRSSIVLWLLVAVCSVSLIWLYILWFVGLGELEPLIGSPKAVLEAALFFGVVIGVIFGFAYGALDVLNHFTLRFLLVRLGFAPRSYETFLDNAVRLRLLRKVGGGYSFFHEQIRKRLDLQSSPDDRSIGVSRI